MADELDNYIRTAFEQVFVRLRREMEERAIAIVEDTVATITSVEDSTSVSPGALPLSDEDPEPVGTVDPGVSEEISRADHVHASGGATGAAGGDLSGTYPNPVVAKIQAIPVSTTDPTDGQALIYNLATLQYVPGAIVSGLTVADKVAILAGIVTNGDTDFPELVFDAGELVVNF